MGCYGSSQREIRRLNYNEMKQRILKWIWTCLERLDKGESYSYSTAPYCGHHYSGFENKYVRIDLHEGFGGGITKISLFGYKIVSYIDFRTTYKLIKKS